MLSLCVFKYSEASLVLVNIFVSYSLVISIKLTELPYLSNSKVFIGITYCLPNPNPEPATPLLANSAISITFLSN